MSIVVFVDDERVVFHQPLTRAHNNTITICFSKKVSRSGEINRLQNTNKIPSLIFLKTGNRCDVLCKLYTAYNTELCDF